MAKKPTTTPATADPFVGLGIGLAADHKAEKAKAQAEPEPEPEPIEAPAPAPVEEAEPTPAAPGDERQTVFDRRLDRLTKTVEFAEFDSGTAFGDLRDVLLDLYRHRVKAWSELIPSERTDLTRHIEGLTRAIVRKIVLAIAQEESLTIQGTLLGKFAVNGEAVEAKLKIDQVDSEVMIDIFKMAGHRVVIVSADDKRFQSSRREIPAEEDQIPMQFADDKPKPSEVRADPPADDRDLAGDDPEEDDDGEEQFEERDPELRCVFDKSSGEYLINEDGGENGWTDNIADAGIWPIGKAMDLATEFGSSDGLVVTVPVEKIPEEVTTPPAEDERTHGDDSAVND